MYTNGLWNEFNCMHSELAHVFKPIITTSEDKCMQYKFVFIMICGTKNSMDVPLSNTLLKKVKGAHTLWQIAVKTDIPSFDTKIQKN